MKNVLARSFNTPHKLLVNRHTDHGCSGGRVCVLRADALSLSDDTGSTLAQVTSGLELSLLDVLPDLKLCHVWGACALLTLLGAPGLTTRSKDATRGSWHSYYEEKDATRGYLVRDIAQTAKVV